MKTQLDILPFELKLQIYDMAKPVCSHCNKQFTQGFKNNINKGCACEFCEDCLLEALWRHTGCDTHGESDSFACDGCNITVSVDITEDL